jgi:hypothetical protein
MTAYEWRDLGDEYLARAKKAEAERDALRVSESNLAAHVVAAQAERDRLRVIASDERLTPNQRLADIRAALASLSNPDGEETDYWGGNVDVENAGEAPEGREGMVTVYDSMTGEYLGCMGRETWEQMLLEPDGEA